MVPPLLSCTAQVTEVFEVPVTVAVNCCFPPTETDGDPGETATAMAGGGEAGFDPLPQAASTSNKAAASINSHRTDFLISRRLIMFPPRPSDLVSVLLLGNATE